MKLINKIIIGLSLVVVSLSANSEIIGNDLIKIDNEILPCSAMPSKKEEQRKYIVNLKENIIISCNDYIYSAKNQSWYLKDTNKVNRDILSEITTMREQQETVSKFKKDLSKKLNKIVDNSKTGVFGGVNEELLIQSINNELGDE